MSGLYDSKRWDVLPQDAHLEARLIEEVGAVPLVARILAARGYDNPHAAREFLTPSLKRDWASPAHIPGLLEVADRVEQAIRNRETIAVFGDFDVDGMTATGLLTSALRRLGAEVHPYIPNRFDEGYGLSIVALERVIEDCNPDLIITVDNGISAANEVAWLLERHTDVAVTDHHEPGEAVPVGIPVANPKLISDGPSHNLAGAGVALKLVDELGTRLGHKLLWHDYIDLAALGTVSDMMPLLGENRALVSEGIARIRTHPRPGIHALATVADVSLAELTSDKLPFSLIPRLNAAGRMGQSEIAFQALLTESEEEARELADRLETINTHRREIESELADEAMTLAESMYEGGKVVVVAGEGWHEGVKGIVASRLVSRFHVPVLLFTISEGVAKGSGRSVGNVDLFHAVEQCSDLLITFGGHSGAVGITLEASHIPAFRERMEEILGKLPEESFEDRGEITAIVSLDEVNLASVGALEIMQPFGQANRKPMLGATGITMRNAASVGAHNNHLRFLASNGSSSIPAIMFGVPDIERLLHHDGAVDIVFEPVKETWQGRTKVQLMVRDILPRTIDAVGALPVPEQTSLADDLFCQVPQILARGEYKGIVDANSFVTKLVGITEDECQQAIGKLVDGEALIVRRHQSDTHDFNGIVLLRGTGERVGFLRRHIASMLAPVMDAGTHYIAHVLEITDTLGVLGVDVRLERIGPSGAIGSDKAKARQEKRRELERLSYEDLTSELRTMLIDGNPLLPAQRSALETLGMGRSCLCVMATGRGKSLIFHIHAAREAIAHNRASVFVYPLRALVTDQSYHLMDTLAHWGVNAWMLTGESSQEERLSTMSALRSGDVDILLTTPEFLAIHADRFAESGRVGFVVIDEAHHAGISQAATRSAYLSMPEVLATLGNPVVLATTATASDKTASDVCHLLGINRSDVIVDRTVRTNLGVRDGREMRDRDAALVSIVASGEKTVIYANSRKQTVVLARFLRRAIPDLAQKISFYNAGLSRSDRGRVEKAFRKGELSCVISTSAFGEGVNLADIRNVVLYHMPFGMVEFNQMGGRAGRDNKAATIHLLFSDRDARINERILAASAPSREDLVTLYRTLMTLQNRHTEQTGKPFFSMANADIFEAALGMDPSTHLTEGGVSSGIAIFRELGLLTISGYGASRQIEMASSPDRVDLEGSIRYREGIRSRDEFYSFREWALYTPADVMLSSVNRPITPSFGTVVG